MHDVISHASRRLPDISLCRSFTSPSTALAVIEGLGTRLHLPNDNDGKHLLSTFSLCSLAGVSSTSAIVAALARLTAALSACGNEAKLA